MTTHSLFTRLCDVVNALQAEGARLRFSPHKLVLENIVTRLDALLDQIVDEGVHDDTPTQRPYVGRWLLPERPTRKGEDTPCP